MTKSIQFLTRGLPAVIILAAIFASLVSACSGNPSPTGTSETKMASLDGMPADIQNAPASVREAYQFAAANPEVLTQVPCYCGCGSMGHTSNYSCYVSGQNSDGSLAYDSHALGCSICVDITQDTMRLLQQGKTAPEIRSYVDSTYAKYGPSNMP